MSSFRTECFGLKKSWGNLLFGENEMTREKLEKYIQNNYSAEPDYPWVKYPDYEVFRHTSNKKWFALIMEIPKYVRRKKKNFDIFFSPLREEESFSQRALLYLSYLIKFD